MSNIRASQSVIEVAVGQRPNIRASQSVIEVVAGLGIDCGAPPAGAVGLVYTHTFPSGGGAPPYAFSIVAGSLPFGVVLNPATGVASGIPTTAGLYAFTIAVSDSLLSSEQVDCSISIAAAPLPPAQPLPFSGSCKPGGTCRKTNYWDDCLMAEIRKLSSIRLPAMCAMPAGFRNLPPWDDDAVALPYQAVPFHRVGSIPTPAPADGDQTVTSLSVPLGYDGFLTAAYWSYLGSFPQGSGDLIFRIRINQRYLKDLSNVPYALGSPQLPFPLTEGQLLLCGQTVSGVVAAPNPGGSVQAGVGIVFALIGFFWPRGAEKRYAIQLERIAGCGL